MLLTGFLLGACEQGYHNAVEPTLEISTSSTTYYTQEPVTFIIDSNADFIAFYSGERGNDYAYVDKDRIYQGIPYMSFASTFQAGAQWQNQSSEDHSKKVLTIYYSTDFSGNYTVEDLMSATWHDLTDYFVFPSERVDNGKNASLATPSGKVLIEDIIAPEDMQKPLYFAFRYKIDAYDESLANSRSRSGIMNFLIQTECAEVNATNNMATQADADWQLIYEKGYENDSGDYAPEVNSAMIWFDCDSGSTYEHICWAVSRKILIDTEVNIGCDYSVGIKGFADDFTGSYTYTYAEPGCYDVWFMAANVGDDGKRMEIKKNITVNIVEQGGAGITQPTTDEWE